MRGIKITKRAVDTLKPDPEKTLYLWDTEVKGFGLKLTPKGKRVFVVQYLAPGLHHKTRRYTLGAYQPLKVEDARKRATSLLADVARGVDPMAAKLEDRRAAKHDTVARLFEDFLEYGRAHYKLRTVEFYESLNRLYIEPAIGKTPVAKVSVRRVALLHHDLRGKQVTANRVVGLLRQFFNYLIKTGQFAGPNPVPSKGFGWYDENGRERFLSVSEVSRLGQALRVAEEVGLPPAPEHRPQLDRANADKRAARAAQRGGEPNRKRQRDAGMFESELKPANPTAVAALKVLMLTGWREREVLTLRWADVDLARGFATLPNTKSGKSVRVICAPALEIVAAQPEVKDCPFVFPGRDGKSPLREIQRLWYAARHEAGLHGVRLHDLRHSVASFAGGAGASMFVISKILGHRDTRSSERYAHLSDDVRRTVADATAQIIREAMDTNPESPAGHTSVTPIRSA